MNGFIYESAYLPKVGKRATGHSIILIILVEPIVIHPAPFLPTLALLIGPLECRYGQLADLPAISLTFPSPEVIDPTRAMSGGRDQRKTIGLCIRVDQTTNYCL